MDPHRSLSKSPNDSDHSHISTEQSLASGDGFRTRILHGEEISVQYGRKWRRWCLLFLSWIKTSKIHNRQILATKTIANWWCSKNRFCMKGKRQKSTIKHFSGAFFIHKFDRKLRAKIDTGHLHCHLSLKQFSHLQVRTGSRKQKIGDYKIFIFWKR